MGRFTSVENPFKTLARRIIWRHPEVTEQKVRVFLDKIDAEDVLIVGSLREGRFDAPEHVPSDIDLVDPKLDGADDSTYERATKVAKAVRREFRRDVEVHSPYRPSGWTSVMV